MEVVRKTRLCGIVNPKGEQEGYKGTETELRNKQLNFLVCIIFDYPA